MKKSFKILLTALILAGEVLLQSCENFLEGGNFSEQISQNIAYAKANELSILLNPEEGTGSTIPAAGIINLKQGYPFEIEFDAGK